MEKRGPVYSKKNESLGYVSATVRNRTRASTVGAGDLNHYATCQWHLQNYCYFYIVVRADDAVKLSYKLGDENGRENQTKPRWVWSGRHNENDMRCGKRKS